MNRGRENLHPDSVKVKKEKTLNVHEQKKPRFEKHNVWGILKILSKQIFFC